MLGGVLTRDAGEWNQLLGGCRTVDQAARVSASQLVPKCIGGACTVRKNVKHRWWLHVRKQEANGSTAELYKR